MSITFRKELLNALGSYPSYPKGIVRWDDYKETFQPRWELSCFIKNSSECKIHDPASCH